MPTPRLVGLFVGLGLGLLFTWLLPSRSPSVAFTTSPAPPHPRVLCWIPSKDSLGPAIDAILATWGRHCDEIIFTSATANPSRNVVKIDNLPPLGPNRSLWNIVTAGWRYVYETRLDQFAWFVKIDDDSYFSADNFRHLVKNLDPYNEPHYLGHTSYHLAAPFNLGAGHAISQYTLRKVGPRFARNPEKWAMGYHCEPKATWAEDWQFGKCLQLANVGNVTLSQDALHRETFMAWLLRDNFITVRRNDSESWFWKRKPANLGHGMQCCSSRPILWHNFKISEGLLSGMFELEYYLYEVGVDPETPMWGSTATSASK
jgi:hypothetical protein